MLAGFIVVFTVIAVAFILAIGSGVFEHRRHTITDKDTRDMPGHLD